MFHCIALLGGSAEPFYDIGVVLRNAFSLKIHLAK